MSESNSDFDRSSNISLDRFWTRKFTVIANFTHFSNLWAYGVEVSQRYCNVHFYLHVSDSQRVSGMQGTLFKCNEQRQIFGQFLDAKIFWTLSDEIFG